MLADIMTKALAKEKHGRMCELIGMNGLLGSKKEPEIGEWECGSTPLPARVPRPWNAKGQGA